MRAAAVAVDDFNFRWPGLDLESRLESGRFAALEHSDYPGNYLDRDEGRRYAGLRLEEKQCRKMTARFRSTARSLLPGYTFGLLDHPETELNREYLNVRTTHRGFQHQGGEKEVGGDGTFRYDSEVLAIPADSPFRPARSTPPPIVRGSQTAIVVDPDEEEIHTDEFGRVKVQFHWDRAGEFDENSSCYIRVSQGHAGGGYGMLFLPRIGEEVIVDSLEGNPDRPIITGRVYNKDHMPPYRLPAEKHTSGIRTNSTPGGGGCNEIRLRAKKGDEQLALFAEREFHVRSGSDRVVTVGAGAVRIHAGQGLYLTCGSSISRELSPAAPIGPYCCYWEETFLHLFWSAPQGWDVHYARLPLHDPAAPFAQRCAHMAHAPVLNLDAFLDFSSALRETEKDDDRPVRPKLTTLCLCGAGGELELEEVRLHSGGRKTIARAACSAPNPWRALSSAITADQQLAVILADNAGQRHYFNSARPIVEPLDQLPPDAPFALLPAGATAVKPWLHMAFVDPMSGAFQYTRLEPQKTPDPIERAALSRTQGGAS